MDIIIKIHFVLLSVIFVITRSLSIENLEDLSNIASQPCAADGQQGYVPSLAMVATVGNLRNASSNEKPRLLTLLTPEVDELIDQANATYNNVKHWMSAFVGQNINDLTVLVKNTLHIPLTQHSNLTTGEDSLLHILLQFSNNAFFLKKIENDSASVNRSATLRDLRLKIMQVACTLRRLLQPVSDTTIKAFAKQDLLDHSISLVNERLGMRRLVCCIAVGTMLNTFTQIEVSVTEGSVILHRNK